MSQSSTTFVLLNDQIKSNSANHAHTLENGKWECVYRPIRKDKTLKQLGGVFGCWVRHVSEVNGMSEDVVHKDLKSKFLGRIYAANPSNDEQHNWLDSIALHQMNGDMEKLKQAADRISLSWATLEQTKMFMNSIEQHYQSIGEPLPVLDRFYKSRSTN